ncbi:SbcC/MukB-like Walker B domain-containing protein [Dasania marina]|uniref:ATP-binding protein n=1 Tax=Dasania marina TaxID=471499 RepID=UPI0030DA63E8|tara:strand:+ start:7861 stop:11511 length:3651 start_codon:yes stop_codon:yes gene_type:complete
MFCKRGIYVNWGNIPHLEFDFGPINLFSGGNGSGKTTAADGIQSLMTAAHENLFTYNPGQDETTQRGRGGKQVRTLASYVLGCDDGSYARTKLTDGYVAGVFHPTQGETGEVFTAVMCVRARIDTANATRQARQDDLLFLIVPNHELSLSDFVKEEAGGKTIVPITEIANLLRIRLGKDAVESYDKKGPYLRRLYGAFKGLKGAVNDREAKHAARTFSNFMAYKPVKSITEFVAKEILDPKDLSEDIKQVSELMKTIHSMDEETRYIKEAIGNLDSAQTATQSYIEDWGQHCSGEYAEVTRQLLLKQQDYLKQKDDQRRNLEAINDTGLQLEKAKQAKQLLHTQLVQLEAQRSGISALKNKDQLESDIKNYQDQLVAQVKPLLEQDQQFAKNHQAAKQLAQKLQELSLGLDINTLDSKAFRKQLKAVIDGPNDTGLDMQQVLTKDWVGISALEQKLSDVSQLESSHRQLGQLLHQGEREISGISIRDQLFSLQQTKKEQLGKLNSQLHNKNNEIKHLTNHQVSYPPHVEAAIAAIEQQCPQAKPCVLCDYVEVLDPQWQMAIEGYLGGARFSIIVEPEYEAQAIRIVRAIKGKRNSAKIIQGAKAQRDASKLNLSKDSIVEVMAFEHKIAQYFIQASYGAVVRVDNEENLKQTARGLTADGLGSGSYSLFRCDLNDGQLVFGQGARERALSAKQSELHALEKQSQELESAYQDTARIHELVNYIRIVECSDIISRMLSHYRQLDMAENQLANLDLSDFEELEAQLADKQQQHQDIEAQLQQLSEQRGAYNSKVRVFEHNLEKFENEREQLQALQEIKEALVLAASDMYPRFDGESMLEQAEQRANSAMGEYSFVADNHDCLARLDKTDRQLYETVTHHNQNSSAYNNIVYFNHSGEPHNAEHFKNMVALQEQIAGVYNGLKNNVLVEKHEKITSLKESFNTAFVTNLCHSIYQSISDGKRILDDLNQELEHHVFGSDQERFSFGYDWVPEYQEYWRFFKEVIDIPSLGDGSTLFDIELSAKSCQVRDKLLSMLLDKDSQFALQELQRISDYRHYRRYEIYKTPLDKEPIALSKYGTGSGGQLETPAYIIRAAAVTSAFKFNEGSSHCRMVLVDEAFSKMDETRSREVINYLTQALGLQLIFIMPTSKSGPFMDLISNQVVFSKCPTTEKIGELNTRVLVDRKACNQEKIAELWANHRKTIRQQGMLDFMEDLTVVS